MEGRKQIYKNVHNIAIKKIISILLFSARFTCQRHYTFRLSIKIYGGIWSAAQQPYNQIQSWGNYCCYYYYYYTTNDDDNDNNLFNAFFYKKKIKGTNKLRV